MIKKRENLRRALLFFAIGLAFLKFGYTPFKEKLSTKKELYKELTQAYLQKKYQLSLYQKGKKALEFSFQNMTTQDEEFLKNLYPKNADPFLLQLNLSKEIKNLAEKKNLKLEGLDLLSLPTGYKRLTEIPLLLRVKGKTKDVLEFSGELERFLQKRGKLYYFTEYSLSEGRGELSLTLKLSLFKSEVQ